MDLHTFRLLLEPAGQAALRAAQELQPRESDFLAHFTGLSRRFPAPLARAALETAILRREAAARFPEAARMYFTRPALEQASTWEVAVQRARRFQGFERLCDLGCSIGADTLALAAVAPTLGIDLDPLRLAMARANLQASGLAGRASLLQADLAAPLPLAAAAGASALFFDPARRLAHRRVYSVREYQPPLGSLLSWLPRFPALGVKISPGVDLAELEAYLNAYPAEVEFVSLNGELKEAVLWFGPLRTARRRATLLPGPHTLSDTETGDQPARLDTDAPRAYLYEPDPAILRAGLVAQLGGLLEAVQLDPDIAYLTSGALRPTPFARAWGVEDWFPFQLKRLRAYLRERGVSRVVVKKRGSPIQPEELVRSLRLSGGASGLEKTLFLTHLEGQPIVVVCSGLAAAASNR